MSMWRKVFRALVVAWDVFIGAVQLLAVACLAVVILFLLAFIVAAAFELADRLMTS